MKANNSNALLLLIGLLILGTSFFFSPDNRNTFYSYLCSVVFVAFSVRISFMFKDQKMIIRILVFFASVSFLEIVYYVLGQFFSSNMQYVNYIILYLLFAFFFTIEESSFFAKKEKAAKDSIKYILEEKINTNQELNRFFQAHETAKIAYETFVSNIYSIAQITLVGEQWEKVKKLVVPIIEEFEKESKISDNMLRGTRGQERETLRKIFPLIMNDNTMENSTRVDLMNKMTQLVNIICAKDQMVDAEKSRNSQALAVSIAGLLATIILSSISIFISLR